MLLIRCSEVDSAAAFRTMLNSTAKEIAIDRAKCLYREWVLIGKTEALHLQTTATKAEERRRCDYTIANLETLLYQEQQKTARLRPWATIGKVTIGLGFVAGGMAVYNATR